jgi:hypothetical protein
MKKLLAIVVLGLLWGTSGNADHYLGHKPGTGFDKLSDSIKDLQRRRNSNRINDLEGQIEIQNYCQMNTDDKIGYQNCLCKSYELSNVGSKCEAGWESIIKNAKAAKKNEIIDFCKTNHSKDKKKFTRCKCESYEKYNAGVVCKDGWRERNRTASKKNVRDNGQKIDFTKCSIYHFIKYGCKNK